MRINWRLFKSFYIFLLLLLTPAVHALDFSYGLEMRIAKHENIALVADPVGDEWVESLTANLNLSENSSNLVANVHASTSAINYRDNQLEDTSTNELNANALLTIKPRHFEWYVSEVYTQTSINPLQSDTTANRQNVNAFSTGPNYYWRLNSQQNINLEARLESVSYEDTGGDNDRLSSAFRWVYLVNSATTASANSEVERVDYEDDAESDFVRSNLFARIDYQKGRTTLQAEAGYTNIDYSLQDNISGQRYLFAFESQRTRTANIRLEYNRSISDSGSEFIAATPAQPGTTTPTVLSTDVFTEENINFIFNKQFSSGEFVLELGRFDRSYLNQSIFNQYGKRAVLRTGITFSEATSIRLEAEHENTVYENLTPMREDNDYIYRAVFSYTSRRNLAVNLSIESVERESTETISSYEDNRAIMSISYTSR